MDETSIPLLGCEFALLPGLSRWKFRRTKRIMTNEPQAIEVEVVEIDGAAPPAKFEDREESPLRQHWQKNWQSRVNKLDGRWWPLWVFVGAVVVLLLLTVGLFLGLVFVIFRVLSGIVRAIFR